MTRNIVKIGFGIGLTGIIPVIISCTDSESKKEKPNVIVIFADDVGYGDVSCYGATKLKTPNIDKLAEQGRRFTDAHSASAASSPSRYALLTGQYPFRRQLFGPIFHRVGLVIDTTRFTIADLMKQSGYSTACIGKWHLGLGEGVPDWNSELKPGPLELGFDYYFGIPVVNSHPPFVYIENHSVVGYDPSDPFILNTKAETKEFPEKFGIESIGGAKAAHALYDDEMVGTTLTQKAVEWIKNHKKEPFFLYFATTNIHHPFTPHPRFKGTSDCGRYGDFMHELDWIVGEIMRTLDKLKIADNTLLIFTSDNGGMLNQGGQNAWLMGHRLNGDLLGFKFDAWEGGHRVPFIARWPGKILPGTVSDQLISNVDLLATFAEITGYDLKDDEGPDSYNVLETLTGNPDGQIRDHIILASSRSTHVSLRKDKWMFIPAQGGGGFQGSVFGQHSLGGPPALWFAGQVNSDIENGKIKQDAPSEQLYDLENDPYQNQNAILDNPEIADNLRILLEGLKQKEKTRP